MVIRVMLKADIDAAHVKWYSWHHCRLLRRAALRQIECSVLLLLVGGLLIDREYGQNLVKFMT
ncbi:hypothetical protein TI04_00200 [Achromatium sp. WMS2]|nr:hypothetical protein TI04_00200 [Achromatium sp. WMS2]